MTVAVKYCGGCNPRFDRVGAVARLQRDVPGLQIVGTGAKQPDVVLVVCGCSSRCAAHVGLDGRYGKLILDSEEEYGRLLGQLLQWQAAAQED